MAFATYTVKTSNGGSMTLNFEYPGWSTIKEIISYADLEDGDLSPAAATQALEVLCLKSLPLDLGPEVIKDGMVMVALLRSGLLKKVMQAGEAVFIEPSAATT